jgi:PAS domain-containing protein
LSVRLVYQTMPEKKRVASDAKNWALFDPSIAWPALANASPFAIIAMNPEGQVLFWNAAAERIFGWTLDEVLGRPLQPSL